MVSRSYIDDAPSKSPQFEFDLIATALAGTLTQPADRAIVLGLHGPWGSGKTTLMDAVRDQLPAVIRDPIIIEFNAWKYQERSALWRALILRVLGELREHASAAGKPAVDELERSLYATFTVRENGPWSLNWRTLLVEAADIGLSAVHLGIAGQIVRAFIGGKSRRREKSPDYSTVIDKKDVEKLGSVLERKVIDRQVAQVQSVEQFLQKFTGLVRMLTTDDRQVFVFVDDLDRCLPEAALEIFEAIKLFMDAKNCQFIVAVDREVIRRGLIVRYADISRGIQAPFVTVDEYLEKTISISYDVPRLGAADIDVLMDSVGLPFSLEEEHRKLIRSGLGANPRRVKRFMNFLVVQAELGRLAHARKAARVPGSLLGPSAPGDLALLLKLMLISYRYPGIFQAALANRALLSTLQTIANNPKSGAGTGSANDSVARRARLEKEAPEVVLGPNLVSLKDEAQLLMSWFRSGPPGQSAPGSQA
jgi:KAP family P-loop domain